MGKKLAIPYSAACAGLHSAPAGYRTHAISHALPMIVEGM
jgi:hypothetical protein